MNSNLPCFTIFSSGRILFKKKRACVCALYGLFVIILIAFFWIFYNLLKFALFKQFKIIGQYDRCEWMSEKMKIKFNEEVTNFMINTTRQYI